MANIGLRHLAVAKLSAHTPGAEPTYSAGVVMGKGIEANLTITRNNNPLYADDVIAEDDNGITAMSIEVRAADLENDVRVYMLGLLEKETGSGTSTVTEYHDTDKAADYVGFGYVRWRRVDGVDKFQAYWYYKVLFSEESENATTKGESIEWGTPTVTGRVMGLDVGDNATTFRKMRVFTSASDAVTWLNTLAGIT